MHEQQNQSQVNADNWHKMRRSLVQRLRTGDHVYVEFWLLTPPNRIYSSL